MTAYYQINNKDFLSYLSDIVPINYPVLQEIETYNLNHEMGHMRLSTLQVHMLVWLATLMKVQRYLEIGVYTGYSSTAMGLNLGENAQLFLCDMSVTYTSIARCFWEKAGIAHKMNLFLQPALISMNDWAQDPSFQAIDLALIDADKLSLPEYIEGIYPLLRVGGVIAIDNTYLQGRVKEKEKTSDSRSLKLVRQLNKNLFKDSRFHVLMLPLGDGLTLLLKR